MIAAPAAYSSPVWMPSLNALRALAPTGPPAWMAMAKDALA